MPQEIKTISLLLPYHLGSVNCYLVETDPGYILIDTGGSNKRTDLEKALESAGCKPGNLQLIVITHEDFDHTGNCAYLRELAFGLKRSSRTAGGSAKRFRNDELCDVNQGN